MLKSLNMMIFLIISFSLMNLLINLFFSNYKFFHPLYMGILLLKFNIFSSINMNLYNYNSWFSMIVFLIIIGGMMILFLYFISFIMNISTSMKFNLLKSFSLKMLMNLIFFIYMIMYMEKFFNWYNTFNEINNFMNLMKFNEFNKNFYLIYMYMYNKNLLTMMMICYLLLALILIVKMIMFNKYTLRKIN